MTANDSPLIQIFKPFQQRLLNIRCDINIGIGLVLPVVAVYNLIKWMLWRRTTHHFQMIGWVLWHINNYGLFNAKYSSYIFSITYLNEPKLIILLTVKWFQILLCIINYSIKLQSFVYTLLHDQTVLFLTMQFSINHLFFLSLFGNQIFRPI